MDCFIRQQFHGLRYRFLLIVLFFQPFTLVAAEGQAQESPSPWWIWPLILLLVTFLMGIVAVLGGVGGGVLFVPIISGFFPFHLDFVRGTGLLVALSGALAAGPGLLKSNLASLASGDAGCLDRFNNGHRRSHGRARFTHTHHPTQSGRNDSRHRRNHAFCE